MFHIRYYKDKNGNQPVKDFLHELSSKNDKNSRINKNSIDHHLAILERLGTRAPSKYVKYIGDGIWEIRPLSNRIMFIVWHEGDLILLHHFIKKSQKTPLTEIEVAKKRHDEILKGDADYE